MSADPTVVFDLNNLPPKPWQRIAASMFGTGSPVHEIAPQVNQPVHVISEFLTSQQGMGLVKEVIRSNADMLEGLLEAAAVDSLMTLIRIRDTSPNDTARINACKELLSKTLPGVKAKEQKRGNNSVVLETTEDEISRLMNKVKGI
jgi:hypothetical protein